MGFLDPWVVKINLETFWWSLIIYDFFYRRDTVRQNMLACYARTNILLCIHIIIHYTMREPWSGKIIVKPLDGGCIILLLCRSSFHVIVNFSDILTPSTLCFLFSFYFYFYLISNNYSTLTPHPWKSTSMRALVHPILFKFSLVFFFFSTKPWNVTMEWWGGKRRV